MIKIRDKDIIVHTNTRISKPRYDHSVKCLEDILRWMAPFVFITCSNNQVADAIGDVIWSLNIAE